MKKKIKDLTIKDIPKCWGKLFDINNAFMILFTEDEEKFNRAKSTLSEDMLNIEVGVEE